MFFGGENLKGFLGEAWSQNDFPETLGHGLSDFDTDGPVESHDATKAGERVPSLSFQKRIKGMCRHRGTAGIVVLDDDAARSLELPSQPCPGVRIQQVVEREFLALQLFAGGDAFHARALLDIESCGLMGILAIAQSMALGEPEIQGSWEVFTARFELVFHPFRNSDVISSGLPEGRQSAALSVFQGPGAFLLLLDEAGVLSGIGEHRHGTVILGGTAQHGRPANINLLDAFFE